MSELAWHKRNTGTWVLVDVSTGRLLDCVSASNGCETWWHNRTEYIDAESAKRACEACMEARTMTAHVCEKPRPWWRFWA